MCTSSGTHGATITLVGGGHVHRAGRPGRERDLRGRAVGAAELRRVGKASQAITFAPLTDKSIAAVAGDRERELVVVADRRRSRTTTPRVCTAGGANGATITLVAAGRARSQADQPGNATFNAATPVQRSFTVTRAPQTITFGALSRRGRRSQSPVTCRRDRVVGPRRHVLDDDARRCARRAARTARRSRSSARARARCRPTRPATRRLRGRRSRSRRASPSPRSTRRSRSAARRPQRAAVAVDGRATASSALDGDVLDDDADRLHGERYERRDDHAAHAGTLHGRRPIKPATPSTTPAPPVAQSFTVTKADQTITFGPLAERAARAADHRRRRPRRPGSS